MVSIRTIVLCVAMSFGIGQVYCYDRHIPELGHVLVPTVTPLNENGDFDGRSFNKLVAFLAKAGVDGLYVGGSTGEGLHLSNHIRHELIKHAAAAAKKHKLSCVAHVGAPLIADAMDLAEAARKAGADAVSALPPFVGGSSFEEVLHFYGDLAAIAHPLPVLAYYIPVVTKVELSLDQLTQIAKIKGVMGFKFTGYNLFKMSRLINRLMPGQVVYNGQDQVLALGMQYGAHGGIGSAYNFMPDRFVTVAKRSIARDFAGSVEAQIELNGLLELYKEGVGAAKQVATIKRILMFLGVIESDRCAQRKSLSPEEQEKLFDRLTQHSSLIPDIIPEQRVHDLQSQMEHPAKPERERESHPEIRKRGWRVGEL